MSLKLPYGKLPVLTLVIEKTEKKIGNAYNNAIFDLI